MDRAARGVGRNFRAPRVFVGQLRRELALSDLLQRPVYDAVPTPGGFVVDSSLVDGPDPIG